MNLQTAKIFEVEKFNNGTKNPTETFKDNGSYDYEQTKIEQFKFKVFNNYKIY